MKDILNLLEAVMEEKNWPLYIAQGIQDQTDCLREESSRTGQEAGGQDQNT